MNLQQSEILSFLETFKTDLKNLYGSRFLSLILFGSYARGQAREFSDIDLLVLLTEMQSPYVEIRKMSDLKYAFLEKYDAVISTVPTTPELYEKAENPLYRNIKKEGIVI